MTRYVKRMLRRRSFSCGFLFCAGDYARDPDDVESEVPDETIIESRVQHYQRKLVDTMLKILYLERYSFELRISLNLSS